MDTIKFIGWLRENGATVLPTTNSYEIARFIAHGRTNVIYNGRRGISSIGFGRECVEAFKKGQRLHMGFKQKPRTSLTKVKVALIERDGPACFYCGLLMGEDITVEHLIGRGKGGPDCQDNLALAHEECNTRAGSLPLIEKIKLREKLQHERHHY